MCGRFAITLPNDAMARAFGAQPANDLPEAPRYNICPTQTIACVTGRAGGRHLAALRWGFLPDWYKTETAGPLLINARAETLASKPAFAKAARLRRGLIPASGFYEWTQDSAGNRLPWYIHARQGKMLAFAAIWQVWEHGEKRLTTCAIVTCTASADVAHIHHRMPVILAPEDWALWLGESGHGAARLMRPAPPNALACYRVHQRVNSNRAEGAGLIAPLEAAP